MARYQIEDSETGTTLVVEGDAPPTEQDASELFAHARKSNPQVITPDQWAGMSERAARDEQYRLAGNAMNEAGTGLTTALYHDLPAAIGQGLYDVGNVAYEGGVAAMQHGIEEIAGLPADTEQRPGLTTDQAIRKYPVPVQAGIRGGEGLIRSTPQMAIAAVNPYAGALAFGFTPEGFSPKNAAIAAALPFIGSKVGAVVQNMAARAGVSGEAALQAFGKIGGAAGAAGFIGADEAYHISQLPEEEQGDAWIAAAGNVGSMFLLGTMGHSERLKNTDKVLADRASANAETMRGIERDFNRRNAGPAEEGASVPTWEGTTPRQSLEPKVLSPESPTRATRPATQDSIPEPRPSEISPVAETTPAPIPAAPSRAATTSQAASAPVAGDVRAEAAAFAARHSRAEYEQSPYTNIYDWDLARIEARDRGYPLKATFEVSDKYSNVLDEVAAMREQVAAEQFDIRSLATETPRAQSVPAETQKTTKAPEAKAGGEISPEVVESLYKKREPDNSWTAMGQKIADMINRKDVEGLRGWTMHGKGFNDSTKSVVFELLGKKLPGNIEAIGAAIDEWGGISAKQRQEMTASAAAKVAAEKAAKDQAQAAKQQADRLSKVGQEVVDFTSQMTPLAAGKAEKVLLERVAKRSGDKIYDGPRKDVIPQMLADGWKPTVEQVAAVKDPSRTQFNRMDNRQQADHAKRKAAAGQKAEYRLENETRGGFFVVTKAEYDFANHLLNKAKPAASPVAAVAKVQGQEFITALESIKTKWGGPTTASEIGAQTSKLTKALVDAGLSKAEAERVRNRATSYRVGHVLRETTKADFVRAMQEMGIVKFPESAKPAATPVAAVAKVQEHVTDVADGRKQMADGGKTEPVKPAQSPNSQLLSPKRAAKEIKTELVQRLEKLAADIPTPEFKESKVITRGGKREFNYSLGDVIIEVSEAAKTLDGWVARIYETSGKSGTRTSNIVGQLKSPVDISKAKEWAGGVLEKLAYPERSGTVTVEIPGDGTFTIEKTHYAINRTLERAQKLNTSSGGKGYTEPDRPGFNAEKWSAEARGGVVAKPARLKPGKGTSAVGDPMMPPIPPGVPSGVHSSGRMPVAMERIVPGQVDIPTIMDAMENVVRAVGAESPIRTGRFYAQARGIFKTFDKVIRLRAADNIPTAAHEVAHAVSDAVFGSSGSAALMRAMKPSPLYKQAVAELRALGRALYGSTKPSAGYTAEGFSELTRLWLTTENAAKSAPHAAKWLESELFAAQPELKRSMTAARELVDVWRGQGAEGRAAAQSKGQDTRFEQLKKIAKEYLGKQAQVEEFAPLEELSRGFERISGKRLAPSQDPFMLATANRGVAGHILENFVERGVQDIWGNRTGPSLKEAFARLKPVDAENFRNYLWSRRALERWGKGKNPGLTLEDATYLKNKLETPAFIDAASKWYQWWDGVLEYVKAASPATNGPLVDAIRAGSSDYVPLARVLPESAQRAAQSRMGAGMMKMHGSGLPVREIYLQSLLTAERLISRAHKDMVLDSVFKLSQTEGMGWLVERVPRTKVMEGLNIEKIREQLEGMGVDTTAIPADTLLKYASHMDRPTGSDPIMVRVVNGKPEWYQVPAGLFDLLQGVDAPRLGKVADLFLGVPNRAFKMGTTGLRASFSLVTNPLRDLPTFMHQSLAGNPASRMAEYIGSLKDIVQAGLTGKESANWQTFKQLGIGGGTFLGGDIRQAQREVKGLFRGKVFRRLASPVETLREALSFTESAPRLAEMNLVGKESGWKPGARLTPDQAVAMKVAAKRVTTDFSAGGRVGKMVNQAVPFYNAVIQGTRSFGRAFKKEQGFKTKDHAAAKATLTGLALLTLPTIYNWWRNKDEEWYRNLPWRERYLYTNVDAGDGTIVQVPRPAEWGNVFQVVPEILLDSWYQRDPVYLKEGLKHIFATQNPLDYPVLLKLAKEQWSNRIDFFDKPIVPRGELDLPPGQQRAYFSSIIAKSLGDAFPNTVSPRRVDAAVRGIFGGVGSDLADAPGAMMRMMGIKDSGVRESEPADIPVMGRLFRRGGEFSANGRYLADFWDSYMQHQARLKGNTHSLKAGGQPTATSKELVSARILTAYHAAIKLQMEMAARATEQEDRRRLYKQATETARRALEATK
jgi:hypothetical protein